MDNARVLIILTALAVVLLSAVGAERAALCRGHPACFAARAQPPAAAP